MKSMLSIFRRRWFVSVLGLAALGLLIWYAGPFISIAEFEPLGEPLHRALAIVLMVIAWGLGRLRALLKARRNDQQMLDGLVTAAEPEADPTAMQSDEEIAALSERFGEAVAVLKAGQQKKRLGKQFLYQLPWYLFIGPPGAGKTTALVNSGLEFPLAERFGQDPIRGIAGTRNCDWWFSEEAVFLDTAGRYTTQDSQAEVDRSAWIGFLDLLKRHRRRRPINGVLVAVSVSDLLERSDSERALHARAVRDRVAELHEHLGIRFPVYVLLTKCDLVAGFMEYFGDLGREERAQVWGMTFELAESGGTVKVGERFASEFDGLSRRLNERLLTRLQMETDPQRRDLTFGFLHQFAALKQPVREFLSAAFDPSRYAQQPMLRGVYFSSGTQEGTPIDRVIGQLARRFGLSARSLPSLTGHGRSYFIGRLLRGLVFPEAGLAGVNLRAERFRALLHGGAYALVVGLVALLILAWSVSYQRNKAFVADLSEQARAWADGARELAQASRSSAFSQRARAVEAFLPLLNSARALPGVDPDLEPGFRISMRFGLYQGTKLARQTQAIYRQALQDGFLPRLMLRLEEQIREGFRDPQQLYRALRIYLMLTDPSRLDRQEVETWIRQDWENSLPRDTDQRRRRELETHLAALLDEPTGPPIPLDQRLVARAQEVLARIPAEERAYARIRGSRGARELEPFRVSAAVGSGGLTVLQRDSGVSLSKPLDGLFTYAGYQFVTGTRGLELLRDAAADSWVLGEEARVDTAPEALTALASRVNAIYFDDYIGHWTELLDDIRVAAFSGLEDGVRVLRIASAEDSPLTRLLKAVERETALETRDIESGSIIEKSRGQLEKWKDRIPPIFDAREDSGAIPSTIRNPVERRFSALHAMVRADEEGGPLPIETALEPLRQLYLALEEYVRIPTVQRPGRIDEVLGGALDQLELESAEQPGFVGSMLGSVGSSVEGIARAGVGDTLEERYRAQVYDFCREAIIGRYPFATDSKQEVRLADFGRFFGPNGKVDTFFQKNLVSHVDTSRRTWLPNPGAPIGRQALAAFQLAHRIKEQFFGDGSGTPSVRFQLTAISMSADADQFLLDIDGQLIQYRHDPRPPMPLQWPAPNPTGQVYFRFSPPPAYGASGLTERGPWAWFRILDHARLKPTDLPERFELSFELGNYWARYELWAASAFNPFGRRELSQFWCPNRL